MHPTDDDLEAYAMDRLADAAPVEEHLLICEACRQRVADWDAYIVAMKTAMRETEPQARSASRNGA